MSITRYDRISGPAKHQLLKGYSKVHEEFGDMGTGKTTRANALAERLSLQGKHVIVIDGLERDWQGGVQVFVKE